jgi:hypothetical protein
METIAALMEPRDSALGWLVAPTYDVADRIFKRVTALVLTHFPHRVIEHLPREHRIIVRNFGAGVSELRAKSADRPESLLGEALDFLVVDEGARLRPDVWNTYLSQLGAARFDAAGLQLVSRPFQARPSRPRPCIRVVVDAVLG